jgi:Ca-activated chloride channel family protein
MLSVPTIIAIIGGILFLLGLIGGGFEVKETKMPYMSAGVRFLSILTGLAFLGVATWLTMPTQSIPFPISSTQQNSPSTTNSVIPITPSFFGSGKVLLTIASSSTKQSWMTKVASQFQALGRTTSQGKKIEVNVTSVSSGGSMADILAGKLKPVVWSPGTISWVEQLNMARQKANESLLMGNTCQPIVATPLGFAMWRPMAEALGWPDKPVGWQTIVELAEDPKGWERYGHAEWGKFHLGHAHPKYGNSGLLAVTSFVYGMARKTDKLTVVDVYAPKVESALRALAQNTAKYGLVTEDLVDLMVREGPRYLHAVVTYESDAVRVNMERSKNLRFPIAFIFPAEGTFWGDHPYCVLDQAEWVTAEQIEAANLFRDYLLQAEQQSSAIESLLRPLDSTIPLREPLVLANGTDPRVNSTTIPPLTLPNAEISAAIIDLFMITKRKATVIIALDTSGSMDGEKMRAATESTVTFLQRLQADDHVGILTFSTTVNTLAKVTPWREVAEELSKRVTNLLAGGSTALYDAVCQASELMKQQQVADIAIGENRLYGIVLLSDGADTNGYPTENQMFSTCLPQNAEVDGVKIFPIAFGEEANKDILQRIAEVSGGHLFKANSESLAKIYLSISAEQ